MATTKPPKMNPVLRKSTIKRLVKNAGIAKRTEHAALVVRAWLANCRPHFQEVVPERVKYADVSNYTVVGGFNDPSGDGYWVTLNIKVGELDIERVEKNEHLEINEAREKGRLP